MKTRRQKRDEALERQGNYTPDPNSFGIRQQVKTGALSPRAALAQLGGNATSEIRNWLYGAGSQRFEQARRELLKAKNKAKATNAEEQPEA